MSWVKLEKGNDWGRVYYALPGKRLTPDGFASIKNGIDFENLNKINIRFPSGKESCVSIVSKEEHATVGDMGHTYSVKYNLYGFKANYDEISTWIDLDQVEVWQEDLNVEQS